MTFEDFNTFYTGNQGLIAGLCALVGVAVLLVAAKRLHAMKEHRAALLVANILTIIAAALATMVSASGMWKFFTDMLGETPLRIAFFAFLEVALFASALLARTRLLRDPDKGRTGVDGIAVWVLATLTGTLSALDSDSFREVCLRLVAPLVAAWMWERALAAERHVRLGNTARRINWAITPHRIFVWLRLADASGRDVSQVDQARRRAKLGRARLHLHLLQSRKAFAWRIRRAHRRVVKQAMQATEHLGLADFPDAATEREAIQMYMATLYGFVDATSPQAVTPLNAWRPAIQARHQDAGNLSNSVVQPPAVLNGDNEACKASTGNGINAFPMLAVRPPRQAAHDDTSNTEQPHPQAEGLSPRCALTGATAVELFTSKADSKRGSVNRQKLDPSVPGQRQDLDAPPKQTAAPPNPHQHEAGAQHSKDKMTTGARSNGEADHTAVAAMRRFWEHEVANGRIPTGAQLSRAARVPPTTGLGRRKRREWEAELPGPHKTSAGR